MKYKELAELIASFSEEEKNQDVTVFVNGYDEYYPLVLDYPVCKTTSACDVLDEGHWYLVI